MVCKTHSWKAHGYYRICHKCGLSNLYLGISNEEAVLDSEVCEQEPLFDTSEDYTYDGKTFPILYVNGLFVPQMSAPETPEFKQESEKVHYTIKMGASKPLKVSPHSNLGKMLTKKI